MTVNNADAAAIQFEAGIAFCKASHGALADRWQEIGRQQCEQTHDKIKRQGHIWSAENIDCRIRAAHRDGRTQGAVLGLGVAFALAVVAGWMSRYGTWSQR